MAIRQVLRLWERTRRLAYQAAGGLTDLVCPARCAVCAAEPGDMGDTLCPACWQQLRECCPGRYCPTCGHDTGPYALIDGCCHRCQHRRPAVSRVVRVGPYEGPLRELILAFKFGRQSHLDAFLGDLLASAILGDGQLGNVDLFIPIPLHWRRRWSRGYDQAELLAQAAARRLRRHERAAPVNGDLLRVRHTPPQTSLAVSQRLFNLRRAFAVRPEASFAGKHLCLIDDVATTGTTLRVAAQALRKAGAARVSAAVLSVAAND